MPPALSPSSVMEFQACPQSFLLRYIYKIREPTTPVLTKGTMVHAALEKIFELKRSERTLENLHNLLRLEWSKAKKENATEYAHLFANVGEEREWGLSALKLLDNYYEIENPKTIETEPVFRERWVRANFTELGETSTSFMVRGIVDRLDLVRVAGSDDIVGAICDYKSGKAPDLKYSPATNERIKEEKFWQLKIYALLLREMNEKKREARIEGQLVSDEFNSTKTETESMQIRVLRLMFLTNQRGKAEVLEYDLGESEEQRNKVLDSVEEELKCVWRDVKGLVEADDPSMWKHCDRKFCSCHSARRVFVRGLSEEQMEKNK
ncbi:hypothetical protein TrCOL_g12120 [Triparma columacea]|uniref:PD-(D/E)XK endonuclease-like domain-containing protein n=1 Tax=Triparma columacea TaxID=722753 RepID=A0A9W7L3F9_9STRA|nr:hypothetical protein TrCOL_g12120 [Triparma columacea]